MRVGSWSRDGPTRIRKSPKSEISILSGYRVPPGQMPTVAQMPPIVTRAVDHEGHQLLDDWINSLPACP